jgi:DNA-binding NarL/FixJ family response regulator
MNDKRIRIVAIEDHALVLEAIAALIGARDDMALVAAETSGRDGLRAIAVNKPNVAVIAISVAETNVLAEQIVNDHPTTKVIILSRHEDCALVQRAFQIGAKAYVSKRSSGKRLLEAIAAVAEGEAYVDPGIPHKVLKSKVEVRYSLARGPPDTADTLQKLSEREADIVRLFAVGHTTKEIARQLSLSLTQIGASKSRAFRKLDLRTRTQLVRYAATRGWLSVI